MAHTVGCACMCVFWVSFLLMCISELSKGRLKQMTAQKEAYKCVPEASLMPSGWEAFRKKGLVELVINLWNLQLELPTKWRWNLVLLSRVNPRYKEFWSISSSIEAPVILHVCVTLCHHPLWRLSCSLPRSLLRCDRIPVMLTEESSLKSEGINNHWDSHNPFFKKGIFVTGGGGGWC